jgi:hypothetical protein
MGIARRVVGVAIAGAVGCAAVASLAHAQGLNLLPGVPEVANDSLPDVAMATVGRPDPVIYYNPRLMNRYGPLLGEFFLAHEYGHLFHHHSRTRSAGASDNEFAAALRDQELDADCFAAQQLGRRHREAIESAIRFFTRLGPFRFDAVHPTGAQRAGRLLECLPDQGDGLLVRRDGDTGVEPSPVSGEADHVRFRLQAPALEDESSGRTAQLWIDGHEVGVISNLRIPSNIEVTRFGAGLHSYRVTLEVYSFDWLLQLTRNGMVSGSGHIAVKNGDAFTVRWSPGEPPALVKDAGY